MALLLFHAMPAAAQDYAGDQSIFIYGAGARAIGLGNAYVALANDATAIYWNPAGLDRLQRKNLVFFYSPLLEGTSYNYIGYAHPTLQFGTLGAGILHYSTGDIQQSDRNGRRGDTFSHSRSQFLLSYSRSLFESIILGTSLKVERVQLFNGNATGVGLDVGLLYVPDFDARVLQDLVFGISVQNAVAPRLKVDRFTEAQPWLVRAGFSKPIGFNGRTADGINILFGMQSGKNLSTTLNFGTEYIFQNRAMLRIGHNGSALNFGGGLWYQNFRLDYAFGKFGKDAGEFGPQHRLSLTIEFGRTKTELIELARQEELRRIEEETERQVTLRNKLEFERLMDGGKAYYQQGDYIFALIRFSAARDLFPDNPDARQWVQRAKDRLAEVEKQKAEALAQQTREQAEQAILEGHFQRGQQLLQAGKYREAIAEWQRGLDRDPDNALFKEWIAKTRQEIEARSEEILRRAATAEKTKNITAALELYDQVLEQGIAEENERQKIQQKIAELRKQLTFNDLFRQGLTAYINKNYLEAMKNFEEALKIRPGDQKVRQYLDDAEARANARVEDFANERIRLRFLEAVRLIQREKYQEALDILEQLQKQQRYNKRILDAIDLAKERLSR